MSRCVAVHSVTGSLKVKPCADYWIEYKDESEQQQSRNLYSGDTSIEIALCLPAPHTSFIVAVATYVNGSH